MSEQVGRRRGVVIESLLWIAFAVGAFVLSFDFDKDIEIYKFNATGWPRFVLLLIVLAAIGHLLTGLKGSGQSVGDGSAQSGESAGLSGKLRILALLAIPLLYAYLLQSVGFYILTPFFIFSILFIAGERRWQYLIGVTVVLYLLLLLLFARWLFLNLPIGTTEPFYSISNEMLNFIRMGAN